MPDESSPVPAFVWLHLPTAAVLAMAVSAAAWPGLAATMAPRGPLPPELFGWALIGALAALYQPFPVAGRRVLRRVGSPTLGLGTSVLAPAILRLGAVPAVWVACLAFLLAEASQTLLERRIRGASTDRRRVPDPRGPEGLRETGGARRVARGGSAAFGHALWIRLAVPAGAALVAGAILAGRAPVPSVGAATLWWAWPIVGYLASFALLLVAGQELELRFGSEAADRWSLDRWLPLILDVCGWMVGLALVSTIRPGPTARAVTTSEWGAAVILSIAFALLAAEAARQAVLRQLSEDRTAELEQVQKAHARILGETSGLRGIAQQILSECRRVLPVQWFQLELIDVLGPAEEAASRPSWAAGPDGVLFEGLPDPPERPRMLPGIHRRVSWRIFERALEVEGEVMAIVRLWCDPRRVKEGAEELFSSLVPQMSSSMHRSRLEREAHLDPLTQVPLRRTLERRLANAYRRVCEDGGTMAVIMCDLDFFKSINDTYGHAAGDQALIAVARALEEHRREEDFCCRYGGEEFALLLERANGEAALLLAERLRVAVETIDLVHDGRRIPLALSAGVAAFPEVYVHAPGELLQLADDALYEAKEQGRNRCLLNAGQGRFCAVSGDVTRSPDTAAPEAPRIFG